MAKSRYPRTDQREFIKQMTQIEHHQARITHIHEQNLGKGKTFAGHEQVEVDSSIHHCIGKSKNFPEHITLFTQSLKGDPSVKVCCVSLI
jgi:hypothetical protein